MQKVFGIYNKLVTIKEKDYLYLFDNLVETNLLNKIVVSNNLYLVFYSDEKMNYKIFNDILYTYTGNVYFDCKAKKDIDIEQQKINKIIELDKLNRQGEINGNFNIIKYNTKDNNLFIYNDSVSHFPLYFYEDNEIFMFCNDYEPLVKYNNNKFCIDINAIYEYLIIGAPQNNKTFFSKIQLLAPNSIITIQNNKVKIKNKTLKLKRKHKNKDVSTLAKEYYEIIKFEVNNILSWFPDLPISLTAGVDTRIILSCIPDEERSKSNFFTLRNLKIHDTENQDIIIAKLLSEKYNLKHQVIDFHLFSFEKLNDFYFKDLFNNNTAVLSGQYGTETQRFQYSYPLLSHFIRKILDNTNKKENKLLFNQTKQYYENYINFQYITTYSKIKKESLLHVRRIKHNDLRISYMLFYLTTSFFSNHWEGAKGRHLMPVSFDRCFISPFLTKKSFEFICTSNIEHLHSKQDGLCNTLLCSCLKDYSDIESNSEICEHEGSCFLKMNTLQNQNYFMNVDYTNIDYVFDNKYIKSINVFNLDNIKNDFYLQKNPRAHVFLDLLLWFNYIDSL